MTARSLEAIFALHRAVHAVGLALDAVPNARVTQAEAFILAYLHGKRAATIAELHRAFGHRRSTLTAVVDRLVERGLASREASAQDRRSIVVRLSSSGMALSRTLHRALTALQDAALADSPKSDVAAFRRVLARFIRVAEKP